MTSPGVGAERPAGDVARRRRRRRAWAIPALALIAAWAPLAAVELALQLRSIGRSERVLRRFAAADPGVDFDLRTHHQVLADAATRGEALELPICPSAARRWTGDGLLPLGGLADRETLLANENGYWVTYRSDRYGFRNPDRVHDERGDAPRVVLLGDSYAQGVAVGDDDEAAAVLRSLGYTVLSLGCGSNAGLAELASYVEYGRPFDPDVVVWLFYEGNDLAGLREEEQSGLGAYLDPGFTQDLRRRPAEVEAALMARPDDYGRVTVGAVVKGTLTLRELRRRLARVASRELTDDRDATLARFTAVARAMRDRARGDGAELVFVYLPEGLALMRGERPERCDGTALGCKGEVLEIVAGLDVTSLDFETRLRALPDLADAFPHPAGFGHYSPLGYQLLAESIAEVVAATDGPATDLSGVIE